jgi:hypothetical protein
MKVPFTIDQFLQVFKNYNLAIWPMQIVFYMLSFVMIYLAFKKSKSSDIIIQLVLASLWFWMGIVYHFGFFTSINKAAWVFGSLNVLQGFIFLYFGIIKTRLTYTFYPNFYGISGLLIIIYALAIYPVIGYFSGHEYPYSPTFGLPCPTSIFTMGLLLLVDRRLSLWILAIPFLWSVVGTSAALNFEIKEDIGLFVSGVVAFVLIILKNRKFYPLTQLK